MCDRRVRNAVDAGEIIRSSALTKTHEVAFEHVERSKPTSYRGFLALRWPQLAEAPRRRSQKRERLRRCAVELRQAADAADRLGFAMEPGADRVRTRRELCVCQPLWRVRSARRQRDAHCEEGEPMHADTVLTCRSVFVSVSTRIFVDAGLSSSFDCSR